MTTASIRKSLDEIARSATSYLYRGLYAYTIAGSSSAGTFDLVPTRTRLLGQLPKVAQCAAPGIEAAYASGAQAFIMFADGDPRYPIIVGYGALRGPNGVPTTLTLNASSAINCGTAAARAVREGDIYSVGTAIGPITFVAVAGTDVNPTKVYI